MRSRLTCSILALTVLAAGCETVVVDEKNESPPKGQIEPACFDWVSIPGYRVGEYRLSYKGRELFEGGFLIPAVRVKYYRRADMPSASDFELLCNLEMDFESVGPGFERAEYLAGYESGDEYGYEEYRRIETQMKAFSRLGSGKYFEKEVAQCSLHFKKYVDELRARLCD